MSKQISLELDKQGNIKTIKEENISYAGERNATIIKAEYPKETISYDCFVHIQSLDKDIDLRNMSPQFEFSIDNALVGKQTEIVFYCKEIKEGKITKLIKWRPYILTIN